MKRIIAGSYDYQEFIVTNVGNTAIKFDYMDNIQGEFKISRKFKPISNNFVQNFLLMPGEDIKLVLMYFPIDVSMNKMYLPFKINGLLGPPHCHIPDSLSVCKYLEIHET